MLTGCMSLNQKEELDSIENYLNKTEFKSYPTNNHLELFDYYLPSDLREIEVGDTYILFDYDGNKLYLNLNISGIISSSYYTAYKLADDGFFNDKNLLLSYTGIYKGEEGNKSYYYKIYKYDNYYFIHYLDSHINIYGSCPLSYLQAMTKRIMVLVNSIELSEEEIVSLYSNKDVIGYEKKPIDLFEYIIPSNGILEELLIDKQN